MEEIKESLLEKVLYSVKEFFSMPWIYSSSEDRYSLPKTRRRSYEIMDRN